MVRGFLSLIACISTIISAYASQELRLKDVRVVMENIFSYHIEDKEFSPRIIKRSFKLYIEQFDPEKIYLTKSEIEPFLDLNTSVITEVMQEYSHDRFSRYSRLHCIIQGAIYRHQKIRKEQINRLIHIGTGALSQGMLPFYSDYSSTVKEIEERIFNHLLFQIKKYEKSHGKKDLTPEMIRKILHYTERKRISHEAFYLDNSEHTLTLHLLKAMTKSLDAHTSYYTPQEAFDIRSSLKKEFSGVGVVLRESCDGVMISNLVDNGPAQRCGQIMAGDILCSVDYCNVENMSFKQLMEILKGRAGNKVVLGIKRKSTDQNVIYVPLIQENIIMNNERVHFCVEPYEEGVIGKITIPSFYDNGGELSLDQDLGKAFAELRSLGGVKGIILDLRKNSGGFLTQAIKVAALFIDKGVIVTSKYRDGKMKCVRNVGKGRIFEGPLVILISKASASAAEVVAQTLQDYGVALVVGDKRSYGKGSMQHQTLTDEGAQAFFTVTVGRYYSASGRSPQIEGVQADIIVPTMFFPYNIGEKYLAFPLAKDQLSEDVFRFLTYVDRQVYQKQRCFAPPYLRPYHSKWRQMLPTLNLNSRGRLSRDCSFQNFLQMGRIISSKREEGLRFDYGVEDLQIKESVEIIKDMLSLHSHS